MAVDMKATASKKLIDEAYVEAKIINGEDDSTEKVEIVKNPPPQNSIKQ